MTDAEKQEILAAVKESSVDVRSLDEVTDLEGLSLPVVCGAELKTVKVSGIVSAETAAREAADEELRKIVFGDPSVAHARKNAFVALGNFTTFDEFEEALQALKADDGTQHDDVTGCFRLGKQGCYYECWSQAVYYAQNIYFQVLRGNLYAKADGSLAQDYSYHVLYRYYRNGAWEAWSDFSTLKDGSVTTAKLASNAVTSLKIADYAVTAAKLADGSVTTAKIADVNVTAAKLADRSVTTAKIAIGSVTEEKLNIDFATVADIESIFS